MTNAEFVEAPLAADGVAERQAWMGLLARSPAARVRELWASIEAEIGGAYSELRPAESGLVMVRGRAGGAGARFNLGEMTVTRAAVRVEGGATGIGYVAGRDKTHATIAALVDAHMQAGGPRRDLLVARVLEPLASERAGQRAKLGRKVAATKVNFFTMVRSRQDKA